MIPTRSNRWHRAIIGVILILCAGAATGYFYHAHTAREYRPDFTLADLNGRPRSPGDYADKVLVINFWATWCAPCRKEIPMLVAAQKDDRARGLRILGVAIDSSSAVRKFARQFHVNYPLLADPIQGARIQDRYTGATDAAGALPFTAIVNRKGEIVARIPGAMTRSQFDAQVGSLLGDRRR